MTQVKRVTLSRDGGFAVAQLPPPVIALARTVDATVSASTEVTLNTSTTFVRVYAVDQDIYMKWGTDDVTSSNFDQVIPAGQIMDFFVPVDITTSQTDDAETLYTAINFIERTATALLILMEY